MNETSKTLRYLPEQGELYVGPLQYMLIQPELVCEIQKGIEDRLGGTSFEYIHSAGFSWAAVTLKRMKSALGHGIDELAQAFCRHATQMGWGHWNLEVLDPTQNHLEVRILHSPLAQAYGESATGVCHLFCGAISGLAEALFSMPTSCRETACLAQGNPHCVLTAQGHDVAGAESWSW